MKPSEEIPPEAASHTAKIASYIFDIDRSKRIVEFVSVTCKKCGEWLSAPRLSKIDGVGIHHVHSILVDRARPAYYANSTNCPKCNRENDANYKFCIHCGAEIPPKDFQHKSPQISWNIENSCAHCKVTVTKSYFISDEVSGKKFCSPECRKEYLRVYKNI